MNEKESRFYLVGVVLLMLIGAFLFGIREVFSPFLLAIVLISFLLPFRDNKSVRVLIALVFVLFMIWLFAYLQDIISPFILAFALAYLFDPVVDVFERRKVSRTVSIAIILVVILSLFTLFGVFVVPQVTAEFRTLAASLPSMEGMEYALRTQWLSWLAVLGVDTEQLIATVQEELSRRVSDFVKYFTESAQVFTTGLSSMLTQLLNLIIIPFVMFYFLRDFDKNIAGLRARIPDRHRERFEKTYDRVNSILNLYIRGKILAAGVITLITWMVLAITGIKFALIIGVVSGVLSLLPYVGTVLIFVVGIVLGLFNPDPVSAIWISVIVLGIIQVLDMLIISPRMVGEKLGLHPVLMIFSLFVFAKVWGIVGLLISIPLTAILKVFVMEWYDQSFFKKSFFQEEA